MRRARILGHHPPRDKEHQLASRKCRRESTPQTRRGLETWHGRDGVTFADERARQRGTQTSTYTGAPVLDPTDERDVKMEPWLNY